MALLPKVKLKVVPHFPANIIGGIGIETTRQNGAVIVDMDWSEFALQSSIPTSPTNNVLTFDTTTNSYIMIPSQLLGGAASGIAEAPVDGTQYARQGAAWMPVNFIQAGTGAVVRTMQDKARDVISVKDFGALGNSNGTAGNGHDDTAAIQAAINAASAVSAYVQFPVGIYRITATLTGSTNNADYLFRGEGYGSRIFLDVVGNVTALAITPSVLAASAVQPSILIEGLNFIKPTTATAAANRAVLIQNSPDTTIRDCYFDQYYSGITAVTSYGFEIIQNNFTDIKSVALYAADPSLNAGFIEKNYFNTCGLITGDAAINIGDNDGGLQICGNVFEFNNACIVFSGHAYAATVSANYFEGSTAFDLYVSGTFTSGTIAGNRFGSGLSVSLANITSSSFVSNVIGGGGGTIQFDPLTSTGNYIALNTAQGGATFRHVPNAVMKLPNAANSLALRYIVSDSSVAAAGNFGAAVLPGGLNVVPVYSDGTVWRIG